MIQLILPKNKILRFLFFGYWMALLALFFYSFTQVDLSLTLSRLSVWQIAEKFFQHIGYFNRPFSTYLFLAIIFVLYIFYALFLKLSFQKKITEKGLFTLIFVSVAILVFSYNAFSYDIFNYIFDAKIITYYHQNPYLHKALDYPLDPMLSFMRWTHRVYPYGPVWLFLTVPLSFLSFQYFLISFFLFKILIASFYIICVVFLNKILKKILPNDYLLGITLFALNPLVLIESLVSGHNDIVMLAMFFIAFFYILEKKVLLSIIWLLLSIGVKFGTIFFVPIMIFVYYFPGKIENIIYSKKIFFTLFIFGLIPVVLASVRTQFQPWYLLYVIPFTAFMPRRYFVLVPTFIMSIFALFEYVPYLFLGNWNPPVPSILNSLTIFSMIISCIVVLGIFLKNKIWK